MFFDPQYQQKTKADPLTLPGLISWLEKQPPHVTYNYCYPNTCLIARYLISLGVEHYSLDPLEIPDVLNEVVNPPFMRDMTYGAALERARAIAR